MKILLGIPFLALVVSMNFGETDAIGPGLVATNEQNVYTFQYGGRRVKVHFDPVSRLPVDFHLIGKNYEPTSEDHHEYAIEEFLEYLDGVGFFFVTTMNHRGMSDHEAWVVKIMNAKVYNEKSAFRPAYTPDEKFTIPGIDRTILVFRQRVPTDEHRHIIDLRFEGMNVRLFLALADMFKVTYEVHELGERRVRIFKLKSGKYIGAEHAPLARHQELLQ